MSYVLKGCPKCRGSIHILGLERQCINCGWTDYGPSLTEQIEAEYRLQQTQKSSRRR